MSSARLENTRKLTSQRKFLIKLLARSFYWAMSGFSSLVRHNNELKSKQAKFKSDRTKILMKFINRNVRLLAQSWRMLQVNKQQELKKIRDLIVKKRGILRRILYSNTRLMAMGFNKLLLEYKLRMKFLKEKLRFVIKSLSDKDSVFVLKAYNGLKERKRMLDGIGLGRDEINRNKLLKMLTNSGYKLQAQGYNTLKYFCEFQKKSDQLLQKKLENDLKNKSRILKRILYANLRVEGKCFRLLFLNKKHQLEKEQNLALKLRGICKRVLEKNIRLMSMGYNKLVEEHLAKQTKLKKKIKFVIRSLMDKDTQY